MTPTSIDQQITFDDLPSSIHYLQPSEDHTRELVDSLVDDGEILPSDWADLAVLDALDVITERSIVRSPETTSDEVLQRLDHLDQIEAKVAAAKAAALAEYNDRRAFRPSFRTAATARARRRRISGRHAGAEVNFATAMADLPAVLEALARGSIAVEHAKRIASLYKQSHHRAAVIRDQDWLVEKASRCAWNHFERLVENWSELVDPRDPADLDPAADKRSLKWGKGVGGTTLLEGTMPHLMFEQLLAVLQPAFDQLLEEEWTEARATAEAAGLNPDDVTTAHLPRTDAMRWHDALMIVVRRGGADPNGADPGSAIRVAVTVDATTLMWAAQAASAKGYIRFSRPTPHTTAEGETDTEVDAEAVEPPAPRNPTRDADNYRCETASGANISPSLALWCALATHIYRVTIEANERSTSLSTSARLFTQSQRIAMLVRDRHCRGPGCGRRSGRLEADHIDEACRGGPTHTANGQLLCPPCHRHKTWLQAMGLWAEVEHLWNPNHRRHEDQRVVAIRLGQLSDPRSVLRRR